MNCQDCQVNISALFDNELTASEEENVRSHIRTCAACAAVYAESKSMEVHLCTVPGPEDNRPEWSSIEEQLQSPSARTVMTFWKLSALVACMAIVIMISRYTAEQERLPEQPAVLAEDISAGLIEDLIVGSGEQPSVMETAYSEQILNLFIAKE